MADFDNFEGNTGGFGEEDPVADFMARQKQQLEGIDDDLAFGSSMLEFDESMSVLTSSFKYIWNRIFACWIENCYKFQSNFIVAFTIDSVRIMYRQLCCQCRYQRIWTAGWGKLLWELILIARN